MAGNNAPVTAKSSTRDAKDSGNFSAARRGPAGRPLRPRRYIYRPRARFLLISVAHPNTTAPALPTPDFLQPGDSLDFDLNPAADHFDAAAPVPAPLADAATLAGDEAAPGALFDPAADLPDEALAAEAEAAAEAQREADLATAEAIEIEEKFAPGETIHDVNTVRGMYQNWFLDYASYVILERAVPAIEDGLKPVQSAAFCTP